MNHVQLDGILRKYNHQPSELLAILQDIQNVENWLPREDLEAVATRLDIPMTRVYRLATFFRSLSLKPRGKHICQVCIGTTCHVRGAPKLLDKVELELGLKPGETSADLEFTLETVGCVGACALGPLVVVDADYHGNLTPDALGKIVRKLKGKTEAAVEEEAD